MPPPSSRMTKQPIRPTRYFPGKALAEDPVSEDESEEEEDAEEDVQAAVPKAPAPKAASFPRKLTVGVSKPSIQSRPPDPNLQADLEGFVTASESSEDDGSTRGSGEAEDSSEEADSSSDDEIKKPMIAPKFIPKSRRTQQVATHDPSTVDPQQAAAEEERKRKEKADKLLQAQIERDRAARKAGKKHWDDDDAPVDEVDDTDDVDPEAEKAAWKLRELKRVQRDRHALIAKEKEREEVERRRNMTAEEREAEDQAFLATQAEEKEGKGKMSYMQRYFHKGAFFGADQENMDDDVKAALNRDIAGRKFVDDALDKSVLPEYMKIRDATRLGKKGRTRYKDLKSEDTGRWGDVARKTRDFGGLDERFRPEEKGGGPDRTGANAAPVGERRRREDDGGRCGEEKRARHD